MTASIARAARWRRIRAVTVALLVACGACQPARGLAGDHAAAVHTVAGVAMTVTDLARSVAFFTEVLDFEHLHDSEAAGPAYERLWALPAVRARVAHLRLGRERLELLAFAAPDDGQPIPRDSRSNDAWFQHLAIVVSDVAAAHARVAGHAGRAISSAPQILPRANTAAAGIAAFYFTDPDGHPLELIQYPPGKGDPRWQNADGRLFLGIDHTAIAVTDTNASLAYYRDRLGLSVTGTSVNVGIEQERLTGVPGARVAITSLRAPGGPPGIELLEYRAPRDGRRLPAAPRVHDVVHRHVRLLVGALDPPGDAPGDAAGIAPPSLLRGRAVLRRDPDGHAVELHETGAWHTALPHGSAAGP